MSVSTVSIFIFILGLISFLTFGFLNKPQERKILLEILHSITISVVMFQFFINLILDKELTEANNQLKNCTVQVNDTSYLFVPTEQQLNDFRNAKIKEQQDMLEKLKK